MKNYKAEMNRMKRHHESYYPVLAEMMGLYIPDRKETVDITDHRDIFTILELIDLGYLDHEAFSIEKAFNEVKSVRYRGIYPLTDAGMTMMKNQDEKARKTVRLAAFAAVVAGTAFFIYVLYRKAAL